MTTAPLLFVANFVVVCALGLQQFNVHHNRRSIAFATSMAIGAGTLIQIKLLAVPSAPVEIFAFLLGGACGIVASMWLHGRMVAAGGRRLASRPDAHAERLGERLRLASVIADSTARNDIEMFCRAVEFDGALWYDTTAASEEMTPFVLRAVRYLSLGEQLQSHPGQAALVRFAG
ncbi:MAG TPA: hypothetical protein VGP22_04570 [Albitalea sp.]|jgi:hypothetical protein|nr:hypothetical protein [Albitalea sp.]